MCEDNAMQEEKRTQEEQTLGAGAVIARRRKVLGLSQEALAEKMDVSRQAVAKWENGQAFPTAERLTRLCRVLEVTPEELLGLAEGPKKRRPWGRIAFAAGLALLWGGGILSALLSGGAGIAVTLLWTLLNLSLLWCLGWLLALAARALYKYVTR